MTRPPQCGQGSSSKSSSSSSSSSTSSIRSPSSQRQTSSNGGALPLNECGIGCLLPFISGPAPCPFRAAPLVLGCPAARRATGWHSNTALMPGGELRAMVPRRPNLTERPSRASMSRGHPRDGSCDRPCAAAPEDGPVTLPQDGAGPHGHQAILLPSKRERWVGSPGGLTEPQPNGGCSRPPPGSLPPTGFPFGRGWHEVSLPTASRIAWSGRDGRPFPGRRRPARFPQAS